MATLRPVADVSAVGWVSTAASVSEAVNEVSPDDGSYATSPSMAGPTAFAYDFTLAQSVPPGAHDMGVRARRTGGFGQMRVALLDGSSTVVGASAWQNAGTSFALMSFEITTTGAATRGRIEVRATETNSMAVDGVELLVDGQPVIFTEV